MYEEMKLYALVPLPVSILHKLSLPEDWFAERNKAIIGRSVNYHKLLFVHNSLRFTAPYVILKGTLDAQYYSFPEYLAQGDIDIMTWHEYCVSACQILLDNGFSVTICKVHVIKRFAQRNLLFLRRLLYRHHL